MPEDDESERNDAGEIKEVTLKVDEARQRDVGRSIIRLDNTTMSTLGLRTGDIVAMEGKRVSAAIAWPAYPQDQNLGIARLDRRIRRNLGVELQDSIKIRHVLEKRAKVLLLTPESINIRKDSQFESFIKRKLLNFPVAEGDEIGFTIGISRELTFKVAALQPPGICIVKHATSIHISDTPTGEGKPPPDTITYNDVGGLNDVIQQVREAVEIPLCHPALLEKVGIKPPKGILFNGPPGSGKTLLVKAIANEIDAHFIAIQGAELQSRYYGDSEKKLRQIFQEAESHAPSILYIDQVDVVAPNRLYAHGWERNMTAQLISLLDGVKPLGRVVVIGESNQPEVLDPALRRPGRFDREISFPIPTEQARLDIFTIHTRTMALAGDVQLSDLVAKTSGLVGADIAAICREAGMTAIRHQIPPHITDKGEIPPDSLKGLSVTRADFEQALMWFWDMHKKSEVNSDVVAMRLVENLLCQLTSASRTEILISSTFPDPAIAKKVRGLVEFMLDKRQQPESTGDGGSIYASKLAGVYFHERPDGTYWLIRKGPNPPNPNALLT